jgi:hypothetical protein
MSPVFMAILQMFEQFLVVALFFATFGLPEET